MRIELFVELFGLVRYGHHLLTMVILGIVLLVIGIVAHIPILLTLGIILAVVGAVLALMGGAGRPVMGRRYWY